MARILTHINVDLDAVLSVFATRMYMPGFSGADIVFVPANWQGTLQSDDVAVDLDVKGRGIKGEVEESGIVHSCFAYLVKNYAPPEDQQVLRSLATFVDIQDSHGSAVKHMTPGIRPEYQAALSAVTLNALLNGFKMKFNNEDSVVLHEMWKCFDALLLTYRARLRAESEIHSEQFVGEQRRVAILRDSKDMNLTNILFSRGVQVIVYHDGNNIGLHRGDKNLSLRMDHPEIRAIVERSGETDWFAHSAGFLYARGTRKAPANNPSKVSPIELAETIAKLLERKT